MAVFSEKTAVSLGVLTLVIAVVMWLTRMFDQQERRATEISNKTELQYVEITGKIDKQYAELSASIDTITKSLDKLTKDGYSKAEAAEKAARDALANEAQIVTDPRNPNLVMPNKAGLQYMRGINYVQ